jgi:hypothetical protein
MDGSRLSLAGAVKFPDRVHAEVVDTFSGSTEMGVGPLADWLAERWRDTAMIALLGSAGAALKQALRDRGVSDRVLHSMSTSDYFAANAMAEDALKDRSVSHPVAGGGDVLDASVAVCDMPMAERGTWRWKPTVPDGDETPVEAWCAAHWAARTSKRVPGRKQVVL